MENWGLINSLSPISKNKFENIKTNMYLNNKNLNITSPYFLPLDIKSNSLCYLNESKSK